jgi:hypothetical protein
MSQSTLNEPSHRLVGGAVLLWLVSLALPGLVFYAPSELSFGFAILTTGWIGVLGGYIGWYANIFWLVAVYRLRRANKPAFQPAAWAAVVAFDTFRVDCVSMGGPCQQAYGLGIGGAIWMTAIFLTLFAAATRIVEIDCRSRPECLAGVRPSKLLAAARITGNSPLTLATMTLLVGFVVLAALLGIYDRVVGNADERDKLNRSLGVFKRTEVCQVTPKPKNKIVLDGPLRLINPPWSKILHPETLLKKGIPVVREGPIDFFLKNPNDPKSVAQRDAIGETSAWLTIHYVDRGLPDTDPRWRVQYTTSLVSKDDVVGFEQDYWRQYSNVYCPSLSDYGGHRYSLANLVRDTVIVPSLPEQESGRKATE